MNINAICCKRISVSVSDFAFPIIDFHKKSFIIISKNVAKGKTSELLINAENILNNDITDINLLAMCRKKVILLITFILN